MCNGYKMDFIFNITSKYNFLMIFWGKYDQDKQTKNYLKISIVIITVWKQMYRIKMFA